jgi:hypothetical protein
LTFDRRRPIHSRHLPLQQPKISNDDNSVPNETIEPDNVLG